MSPLDVLETMARNEKHFDAIGTSRQLPRRDVQRMVRAGLVECAGVVEVCDGDGFLLYDSRGRGRTSIGWRLTALGRRVLAKDEGLPAALHKYFRRATPHRAVSVAVSVSTEGGER